MCNFHMTELLQNCGSNARKNNFYCLMSREEYDEDSSKEIDWRWGDTQLENFMTFHTLKLQTIRTCKTRAASDRANRRSALTRSTYLLLNRLWLTSLKESQRRRLPAARDGEVWKWFRLPFLHGDARGFAYCPACRALLVMPGVSSNARFRLLPATSVYVNKFSSLYM